MSHDVETYCDAGGVTQTAHGFVLPTSGVIPLRYDTVGAEYVPAQANAEANQADVLLVDVPTVNSLSFQNHGPIVTLAEHGLVVGEWYVLSPTVAGEVVLRSSLVPGQFVQFLFFVLDPTRLMLSLEQMTGPL